MGMCIIEGNRGRTLVGLDRHEEAWMNSIPLFKILAMNTYDLGINQKMPYEERLNRIYKYLNEVIPDGMQFTDILVESQYNEKKLARGATTAGNYFHTNFEALGISHIILGMMRERYPNARTRSVAPPTTKMIKGPKHVRKNEIIRRGEVVLKYKFPSMWEQLKYHPSIEHCIEAMFMCIQGL